MSLLRRSLKKFSFARQNWEEFQNRAPEEFSGRIVQSICASQELQEATFFLCNEEIIGCFQKSPLVSLAEQHGGVVIAKELECNQSIKRIFLLFSSPTSFLAFEQKLRQEERNFHQVLHTNQNTGIYEFYDIDMVKQANGTEKMMTQQMIQREKEAVRMFITFRKNLNQFLGIEGEEPELVIESASRISGEKLKISLHIRNKKVFFYDLEQHKRFVQVFVNFCESQSGNLQQWASSLDESEQEETSRFWEHIDMALYSTDHTIRLCGSQKIGAAESCLRQVHPETSQNEDKLYTVSLTGQHLVLWDVIDHMNPKSVRENELHEVDRFMLENVDMDGSLYGWNLNKIYGVYTQAQKKRVFEVLRMCLMNIDSVHAEKYDKWRDICFILNTCRFQFGFSAKKMFELFDEFSRRCPTKYNQQQVAREWKNLLQRKEALKKNPLTIKTLIQMLKKEKPNCYFDKANLKKIGQVFFNTDHIKFQKPLNIQEIKNNMCYAEINTKEIKMNSADEIEGVPGKMSEYKIITVLSLTGTGKTQMSLQLMKKHRKILVILSRVSLCYDFHKCVREKGLNDFVIYEEKHGLLRDERVIVCVNSLMRIDLSNYDCVLIDESESLLKHMLTLPQTQMKKIYFYILNLIVASKQTLLLDYNMGDLTIKLIKDSVALQNYHRCAKKQQLFANLEPPQNLFIHNTYQNEDKKVVFVSQRDFFKYMEEYKDERIFIGCDTKKHPMMIKEFLIKQLQIDENEIQLISSETPEKEQIRNSDFKRIIITSPSITYGVSILDDYKVIFGYYKNKSIDSCEQFQQLSRVRKAKNIFIFSEPVTRKHNSLFSTKKIVEFINENLLHMDYRKFNFQEGIEAFITLDHGVPKINTNDSFVQLQLINKVQNIKDNFCQRTNLFFIVSKAYTSENVIDMYPEQSSNEEREENESQTFKSIMKDIEKKIRETKQYQMNQELEAIKKKYIESGILDQDLLFKINILFGQDFYGMDKLLQLKFIPFLLNEKTSRKLFELRTFFIRLVNHLFLMKLNFKLNQEMKIEYYMNNSTVKKFDDLIDAFVKYRDHEEQWECMFVDKETRSSINLLNQEEINQCAKNVLRINKNEDHWVPNKTSSNTTAILYLISAELKKFENKYVHSIDKKFSVAWGEPGFFTSRIIQLIKEATFKSFLGNIQYKFNAYNMGILVQSFEHFTGCSKPCDKHCPAQFADGQINLRFGNQNLDMAYSQFTQILQQSVRTFISPVIVDLQKPKQIQKYWDSKIQQTMSSQQTTSSQQAMSSQQTTSSQ